MTVTKRYSEDSSFETEDGHSSSPMLSSSVHTPWTSPIKESYRHQPLQSPLWPRWARPRSFRRRHALVTVSALMVMGSIPLMLSSHLPSRVMERVHSHSLNFTHPLAAVSSLSYPPHDVLEADITRAMLPAHLNPDSVLQHRDITAHFRDRLRNDTGYMTSFLSAGWTNDQITVGNLIYLAKITGRVPVLPPFTSYIEGGAEPLPFSQIFDVPRMIMGTNSPIIEWKEIKDSDRSHRENEKDEIGCWNIMEVDDLRTKEARGSYTTVLLNLDISYTRAPASVKLIPNYEHDSHSTYWSLAQLAFPMGREEVLANPEENPTRPSGSNHVTLLPDEQMVCYDYLYYTCALHPFEYERDYSPMWRDVMIHAHWTRATVELAQFYLRKTLRLPPDAPIPPFIAIHARRGDFLGWCGDVPKDDCFAPLSAFAARVREAQDELRARHGLSVHHVIMTGDEKDESWWAGVQELGWFPIDHKGLGTAQQHGNWYPVVLDAVIQSMAMGFVGTDRSTFSHMGRRRVADWNNGATRMVKWGYIGADDH